jgi:hypothetical protein
MSDVINNPAHYGGKDNPFEVIKVLRAWGMFANALRFNTIKYLARAGKKDDLLQDLKKAKYYLEAEIAELEIERAKSAPPV